MDEFLVGSCELQLHRLHFASGREPQEAAIRKLTELFKLTCHPEDHHIPVVICPDELQAVLRESSVSMEDFVRQRTPLPRLHPSVKLQSIHARQRYEAAIRLFGPDMWWAVRLYCVPAGSDIQQLLPREVDQYDYQTAPSDGEVFLKVRYYEETNRSDSAALWRLRISNCKQGALRAVERHDKLLEKLDQLRPFSGLWDGFQLGNMHRCIALHATEEVICYLQHIYDVWSRMTLYDPVIQRATDIRTVRQLELRAPAVSRQDRAGVREAIQSGQIFPIIQDPEVRSRLEHTITQIDVLIPSIKTFHENMKLLTIGMMILRDHVTGDLGPRSVYAAMVAIWKPPTKCVLECRDSGFFQLDHRPDVDIAYRQVFMAALRDFPRLSVTPPRRERGRKTVSAAVDDQHLVSFLRGARRLGFRSRRIESTIARLQTCQTPRLEPESVPLFMESNTERRCGRPFAKSHAVLSVHFYLTNSILATTHTDQPCTLFVLNDFMYSFFGQRREIMRSLATALRQRQHAGESIPESDSSSPAHHLAGGAGPSEASGRTTAPRSVPSMTHETLMEIDPPMSERSSSNRVSRSVHSIPFSPHISFRSLLSPHRSRHAGSGISEQLRPFQSSQAAEPSPFHEFSGADLAAVSRPQSSQGSRSMYSPRQWLASLPEEPLPYPQTPMELSQARRQPYSPVTSLPSSRTSFSPRSLILPEELHTRQRAHPSYVQYDRDIGSVISPEVSRSAQHARKRRGLLRAESSSSENSSRSFFHPESLQGVLRLHNR